MHGLRTTASALVEHPRGILALDAGPGGPDGHGLRRLVATTPGLQEYVSGLVLPASSFHPGTGPGIVAGVRADPGRVPLPGAPGETVVGGTDGLPERMAGHARAGARFVVCRARTVAGASVWAVRSNANVLARYARAAQDAGLVPLLHCGIARDGTHSADTAATTLAALLTRLVAELDDAGVDPRATVLGPGSALPGTGSGQRVDPVHHGELTREVLRCVVPSGFAGIALHTGPDGPDDGAGLLAAAQAPDPSRPLTFCLGRSLTAPVARRLRGPGGAPQGARVELLGAVQRMSAVLRPVRPRLRIA
ncbi:class I fructose-bisphosphate aldolase [Pseudonocardia sp. NPDC049635]|uniref:class I fructose-bisphosphate aldolase n=1 Tax=Pseudonocardia sp. NPDC049635 TaxID=3155506 RepID=UPI00341141C7